MAALSLLTSSPCTQQPNSNSTGLRPLRDPPDLPRRSRNSHPSASPALRSRHRDWNHPVCACLKVSALPSSSPPPPRPPLCISVQDLQRTPGAPCMSCQCSCQSSSGQGHPTLLLLSLPAEEHWVRPPVRSQRETAGRALGFFVQISSKWL